MASHVFRGVRRGGISRVYAGPECFPSAIGFSPRRAAIGYSRIAPHMRFKEDTGM